MLERGDCDNARRELLVVERRAARGGALIHVVRLALLARSANDGQRFGECSAAAVERRAALGEPAPASARTVRGVLRWQYVVRAPTEWRARVLRRERQERSLRRPERNVQEARLQRRLGLRA